VLGVVGESGAGKSVTGSAIIGLIDPPGRIAGGEILLSGERIDNLPPEAMRRIRGKRIGMIFQDPLTSLNPLYRIGEQLVETIRTHPISNAADAGRKRAIDLLAEVGIPAPERIDGYPHEFSGGMRQRVVIALALCAEPEADHRRRADHRARRLRAGADHRADQAARPRARHRGDAGHPRHGRHRRDRRPRRGDVCRPHRRDRPGARRGAAAAAPLCQGADGRDPDARPAMPSGWCRSDGSMPRLSASRAAAPSIRAAKVLRALPCRAAGADRCGGDRKVACHLYDQPESGMSKAESAA
jgi:peptide/nickel transport system ATP-binding protein